MDVVGVTLAEVFENALAQRVELGTGDVELEDVP
jgi:hypothetical protein